MKFSKKVKLKQNKIMNRWFYMNDFIMVEPIGTDFCLRIETFNE